MTPARHLINRSRSALAEWLRVPAPVSPPAGRDAADPGQGAAEVWAGLCAGAAAQSLRLVDMLLTRLERMEADEDDPDALLELYRLDHLASRLRRNAETLLVLSGREVGDEAGAGASLIDVVRAAMSPIERYRHVQIGQLVRLGVAGPAANDVGRLLAELLDNATRHAPPDSPVRVGAHLTEQGSVLVRVADDGAGIRPDRLDELNARLAADPASDPASLAPDAVRHRGLVVVQRLSARHGIRVWLAARAPHGTTASVLLPASLVCDLPGGPVFDHGSEAGSRRVDPRDVAEEQSRH